MIYYHGYSEASKIRFILQVAGESAAGEIFGKFLQNIDFVKEKKCSFLPLFRVRWLQKSEYIT